LSFDLPITASLSVVASPMHGRRQKRQHCAQAVLVPCSGRTDLTVTSLPLINRPLYFTQDFFNRSGASTLFLTFIWKGRSSRSPLASCRRDRFLLDSPSFLKLSSCKLVSLVWPGRLRGSVQVRHGIQCRRSSQPSSGFCFRLPWQSSAPMLAIRSRV